MISAAAGRSVLFGIMEICWSWTGAFLRTPRAAPASPGGRRMRSLWLGVFLFLSGFLTSVCVAQVALGGIYWNCESNGSEGGMASTQAQAEANWLARNPSFLQGGACGALGTPQYRNCPLAHGQGALDVYLYCPGGFSPDGLTCPGQYFVSTDSVPTADCGCDGNNNNKTADPISPANGNVSLREFDLPAPNGEPIGAFERFHKHASPLITALVPG